MRVGIIDLGTNTFNLLVADTNPTGFQVVCNVKEGVALGMGGITENWISEEAQERAFLAFSHFFEVCKVYDVKEVMGFGTSAIRDAENGYSFTAELFKRFSIEVEIIDGLEEAELIYQGVSWSYDFERPSLIMDIGGGSTEFIRVAKGEEMRSCSLNIGVSRAIQQFQCSNPLKESEKKVLLDWFEEEGKVLNEFGDVEVLVGASGSFETFYEMLYEQSFPEGIKTQGMTIEELRKELDWIIASTLEEREKHPYIIPIRRKMAPIAALKTKWILDKFNFKSFVISPCSLKEGVLKRFSKID